MVRNKLLICKEYNIQPSELDRMAFYEYEQILEEINIIQKDEEKRQKEQEKAYGKQPYNSNSMMNSMKNSMPKMPSISMPNISMPKL